MDRDNEDTSGEDTSGEDPPAPETGPDPGDEVTDGDDVDHGADDAGEDLDQVLARVARDTAVTKVLAGVILGVVVIASLVLGVLIGTDDDTSETAATTTVAPPPTEPALESVAGEPCVALVDPLPDGAPPVDVVVGPAPTELVIKDIKEGTGAEVTDSSTVTVNYVGVACSTGKIFDTSYTGGTSTPATFPVAQVIPGFGEGVTGMKVGGQRLIGIPSEEAYGAQGGGSNIAPDEALWFVVEVTEVTP